MSQVLAAFLLLPAQGDMHRISATQALYLQPALSLIAATKQEGTATCITMQESLRLTSTWRCFCAARQTFQGYSGEFARPAHIHIHYTRCNVEYNLLTSTSLRLHIRACGTGPHQQIFLLVQIALPRLELGLKAIDSLLNTELHDTVNFCFRQLLVSAEIIDGILEHLNILGCAFLLLAQRAQGFLCHQYFQRSSGLALG